ncbi:Retrovirus-related Pol polyprotein from transposon 17.6, partial [Mucuna pruriens]
MEEEAKPIRLQQRRMNPTILDVVKKEVTRKDHFPLPSIDQVLEKLAGKSHYCFLDGFSRYMQIHIVLEDQHKTTFTCPFGTFAYTHMPFGLCNAPSTFQRCMTSIFLDLLQGCMEVFMDDFTVYANSFDACLENLSKVLAICIDTNLVLNFEKCHLMVREGIVLGHLVSNKDIEVDKSKIDSITSLPNLAFVREVRSFLGHAEFYKRFIKNFSKIALPLSKMLQRNLEFKFD